MDRRDLLIGGATALAAASLTRGAFAQGAAKAGAAAAPMQKLKIDCYSRHLLWLKTPEEVADACIEMAYDGIDLTVRAPNQTGATMGHVLPANVKTDLPKWVNTIRGAGLLVDTITTNIRDLETPADAATAEAILDAASQAGIKHYWWGTFSYDMDATKPIFPQLDALKPKVAKLAKLNEKYGMKAMYHNYAGPRQVGNSIFDLLEILKNFDPRFVSFHYDTGHATEASPSTWMVGMRAAGPYIGGMSFKDSYYKLDLEVPEGGPYLGTPEALNPPRAGGRGGAGGPPDGAPDGAPGGAPGGGAPPAAGGGRGAGRGAGAPGGAPPAAAGAPPAAGGGRGGGRGAAAGGGGRGGAAAAAPDPRGGGGQKNPWRIVSCPLGMGMVDLPQIAQVMKDIAFQGPVEIQSEYPNGGANNAGTTINLPRAQVLGAMKRDLLVLRSVLGPAGLI